ncbi:ATP-dependent DNA helicase RecG [Pediococcus damnosus]|uniref:ATP-dependent DNA helicase RecG n=1 Tax=Pediococcus damnosus TaxID=51663 RepID=A0AAC9B137_9LACO|nr:ATP-dependent DNA helicase RecG [Pediococcus damnosus]AMV61435.1 ATP-dependent DNA helicase RecG [Pediococcus damnosus]AMV62206.1 ATP-dependent DNA helicase RecG [Pediococcus damnosus]AMV65798.1 ATP-dependent DNA helicase RecG [Pediococcus damnosus]AMV67937.1 ATP-dependent DNA helicase RecG [Pediococcus damnosus]AMV70135.1 ATP-dependent DNA helicase RecG [Pediococcus damnosus]
MTEEHTLFSPITKLPGVGLQRAKALNELGIYTIEDLLLYFPFRYEDLRPQNMTELVDQQKVTLEGTIASEPVLARYGRKKNRLNFRLLTNQESVMVTFFNQPWLKKQLVMNEKFAVYGKWDARRRSLTGMKLLPFSTSDSANIEAIYPANQHIRQNTIKKLVTQTFDLYNDQIKTLIPQTLVKKYRLIDRRTMIHDLHFPKDVKAAKIARRTATFEEFFIFQMELQLLKRRDQVDNGTAIAYDIGKIKAFVAKLPYELTDAQKRVVNEICYDLKRPIRMNRLLQGDVGSGKTIVAAIIMYAAITAGYQTALMAPTEILAEQHANNLTKIFEGTDVNIGLLTGASGSKSKQRKALLHGIEHGDINLLIGTHALIQDDVVFKNLGLVVIDEQHRFGVKQREALRKKGMNADVLAMTATPIPRTLAITSYGEMDVSIIDQMPKGRKPVLTSWVKSNNVNGMLDFVKRQFEAGHQAFVVTPLIEESETLDLKNAVALYEQLQEVFSPKYKVGLLHGRMKSDEKDEIMQQFKDNQFQLLVSTTVIEVGVDVPNVTVMIIYDADRFGLAQLHQLRGRVGRGQDQAYCILVADPKNETGIKRMKIMTQSNDGFKISEADLQLRGSGDVFGNKQSGVPEFRIGDPIVDIGALQTAQLEASKIVHTEKWQTVPEFEYLNEYLEIVMKRNANFD